MLIRSDAFRKLLRWGSLLSGQSWGALFIGSVVGIVGVGITTWAFAPINHLLHERVGTSANLDTAAVYVIVVLGVSLWFGAWAGTFISLLAVLVYDWFIPDPVGTLIPVDPDEWAHLLLFLVVAFVTSQLAAGHRRRATEASRRERETVALYHLSSLIALERDLHSFGTQLTRSLANQLGLRDATLFAREADDTIVRYGSLDAKTDWRQGAPHVENRATPAAPAVRSHLRDPPGQSSDSIVDEMLDRRGGRLVERDKSVYVPLPAGDRTVGVLHLVRFETAPPLTAEEHQFLRAASQQVGMALEKARFEAEAAEAAALRRADQVKDSVIRAISHDLRTPLALIGASADSLLQVDVEWSTDERVGFALTIKRNAERLDRIVANLLDLSQMEAGMLHLEFQYYPLSTLVDDVVERLRPLLSDHVIEVNVPEDLPPVRIDYVAIDRVLSNMLENAARHTPPGTTVSITGQVASGEVIVTVADTGPGIPMAARDRVFDKFYRAQSARPYPSRGSGLGLAVAKGLIDAHGTRIWVDPQSRFGATFRFTLPISARKHLNEVTVEPEVSVAG